MLDRTRKITTLLADRAKPLVRRNPQLYGLLRTTYRVAQRLPDLVAEVRAEVDAGSRVGASPPVEVTRVPPFEEIPTPPVEEPANDLATLSSKYPLRNTSIKYDIESRKVRGRQRAEKLGQLFEQHLSAQQRSKAKVLEVGSNDGMVSYYLTEQDYCAWGIDLTRKQPIPEVREKITFLADQDACARYPFDDGFFDIAFSLNAFEHFPEPDKALAEMIRVTRDGGIIHLDFAPLYYSPWGLHAYKWVSVPYCQFLYSQEELDAYCREHHDGKALSDLAPYVNGWSNTQYKDLWKQHEASLKVESYKETKNEQHRDVVARHLDPTNPDYFVHGIKAVFRRVTSPAPAR